MEKIFVKSGDNYENDVYLIDDNSTKCENIPKVIQERASFTSLKGHEVEFRRPLMKDMKGINIQNISDLLELGRRCVVNISPADYDRLDGADSIKVLEVMGDFLSA